MGVSPVLFLDQKDMGETPMPPERNLFAVTRALSVFIRSNRLLPLALPSPRCGLVCVLQAAAMGG